MKTYARIRDCWLLLPPTAFRRGEQKKRRAHGSGSEAKYEGKRNLKPKRVRQKTLRSATTEGLFSTLNTESPINLCLFTHSSIYSCKSDRGTGTLWISVGLTSTERKTKSQVPPGVVWHTRLSFQGLSTEERKRKWEIGIVEAVVVLLSLTAALRTV